MELRLAVDDDSGEAATLGRWLTSERALRGSLQREAAPVAAGKMGSAAEFVVKVAEAAVSGVLVALAQSLITFAMQRRRSITINVAAADGASHPIDITGSDDYRRLAVDLARLAAQHEQRPGRQAGGQRARRRS
ncbi:effector-associated constant component EACC1 [Actinoplanes regularis]|uniref:effector-associated constant component EACC1 n=1 Tax=Actinoplanes regularis TaxID=52697 RepID=UPI0024A0D794|nr:hypothetical protein [Actinoplanes regularis]GLW32866.1 hypothetical protein Areg01_58040 [Actinoplanes regularis]